jgi:hypothetical protein
MKNAVRFIFFGTPSMEKLAKAGPVEPTAGRTLGKKLTPFPAEVFHYLPKNFRRKTNKRRICPLPNLVNF